MSGLARSWGWFTQQVWRQGASQPQLADFLCPFTKELMKDPVTAEDNFNYERSSIEKWILVEKRGTSPQTGKGMGSTLKPNKALKSAIDKYKTAQQGEGGTERVEGVIEWPSHGLQDPETRTLSMGPAASGSASAGDAGDRPEPPHKRPRRDWRLSTHAPVSSMAEAMSKFFLELDPLRDLLQEVLEGWTPPRIIVLGDESTGKSTILEQLANIPIFPRKRRFCTRLAVHVRLRRTPEVSQAFLSVYKMQDGKEVAEAAPKEIPQENGWLIVQEEMMRLSEDNGVQGIVADKFLVVEIKHPAVPSIDLVDLPGIVGSPADKEKEISKIIDQQLAYDKARGCHDMFLAVVPASGDVRPSTNMAMRIVQNHMLKERTIGVFSKVDQCADSQVLRALVLNESTSDGDSPESLGRISLKSWVACMLKPPQEKHLVVHNFERLFVQHGNELEYFQQGDEHLKRLLEKDVAGMGCLVQHLEKAYCSYLQNTWKTAAMTKVLNKLDEKEFEFKQLGVVEEQKKTPLAKKEVEHRFKDSPELPVGQLYSAFLSTILANFSAKLRVRLAELDGLSCSPGQLANSLQQARQDLEDIFAEATGKVFSHFVPSLEKMLLAEITLDESVPATDGFIAKVVDTVRTRMRTKGQPRAVVRKVMRDTEFIQLCQYKDFTKQVMKACRELFQTAVQELKEKSRELLASLLKVDLGSPYLRGAVDKSKGLVTMSCDASGFADVAETMFAMTIPGASKLQGLHEGATVGAECDEARAKASALKDELKQMCLARDGIKRALFTEEEFQNFQQSCLSA